MYAAPPKQNRLGIVPLVAPVVTKIVGGISFATPSEKRAASVLPAVVSSANNGNLNAVAILDTRRSLGISAERAVWSGGYNQVLPGVLAMYGPQRGAIIASIPASAQASPEAAASWALSTTVTAKPTVIQQIADTVVPAVLATPAGQQIQSAAVSAAVKSTAAGAASTAKSWLIPAALVAGFFFLKGKR